MNKTVAIDKVVGNVQLGEDPEQSIDSAINEVLKLIAANDFEPSKRNRTPSADTVEKIKHNKLQGKNAIIRQYLAHSQKVESSFSAIDSTIPFGKTKILNNLNDLYYEALDFVGIDYFTDEIDIEQIRVNSCLIIEFIVERLRNTAYASKNKPSLKEDLELGINVVVAHAFIECVILENPLCCQ